MGLSFVKGLGERHFERILEARQNRISTLEDFIWGTNLDAKALVALAEAGAFELFGKKRREALWEVQALANTEATPLPGGTEARPTFRALTLFDAINWDEARSSHSTRGHPLRPMRPLLKARGLPDARTVAGFQDGSRIRYAGIVICRQRPGTASGVVFMTLEDETGFINIVIWTPSTSASSCSSRPSPSSE